MYSVHVMNTQNIKWKHYCFQGILWKCWWGHLDLMFVMVTWPVVVKRLVGLDKHVGWKDGPTDSRYVVGKHIFIL